MKAKASRLKHIISMVSCVTRAKCLALRSKTDSVKAQLMVIALTLLSKKKNFSIASISAKIHDAVDGVFRHHSDETAVAADRDDDDYDDRHPSSKDIVLYSNKRLAAAVTCCSDCGGGEISGGVREFDSDDKYPDLRHSLFDEEEEQELADLLDDPNSSISAIDMVKNTKEEGESFNLEDEIDEVADLFITKFHKRMRLQKLLSFKRQQQMLEGST